jgi:hypothetical protein
MPRKSSRGLRKIQIGLGPLMPAAGVDLLWLCKELADRDLPGKFFRPTVVIR